MPLARFYQLAEMAGRYRAEEEQNQLEKLAWHAWQMAAMWGFDKPFGRYRENLGLDQMDRARRGQKGRDPGPDPHAVLSDVERIIAADKARPQKPAQKQAQTGKGDKQAAS